MSKLMKLLLVSLMIIVLTGLFSFTTFAADNATIVTDIYGDMYDDINVTFESPMSDNLAMFGKVDLIYSIVGLSAGIDYFPLDKDCKGIYVGGGVGLLTAGGGFAFGFNGRFGYKLIMDSGLTAYAGYSILNFGGISAGGIEIGLGFAL